MAEQSAELEEEAPGATTPFYGIVCVWPIASVWKVGTISRVIEKMVGSESGERYN